MVGQEAANRLTAQLFDMAQDEGPASDIRRDVAALARAQMSLRDIMMAAEENGAPEFENENNEESAEQNPEDPATAPQNNGAGPAPASGEPYNPANAPNS